MKTKLVYVLTCAPEKTYIEQALMSVYSARYWNPDAYIVLITDNLTDSLLTGVRGEVLQYISEKIVVPFPDTDNMMYRSRWLKTSVRNLVEGDFLFIDCDTIVAKRLSDIDYVESEIAMVLDEHLPTYMYNTDLYQSNKNAATCLGWNFDQEEEYFNSGVIYCKDTDRCHEFYKSWQKNWKTGVQSGVQIDQPSLGQTNISFGHIIRQLAGIWNCQMYMRPAFSPRAYIMHFWSYRNESFLFSSRFLNTIREQGLTDYIRSCIIVPFDSEIPFENIRSKYCFRERLMLCKKINKTLKDYATNIDGQFETFPWISQFSKYEKFLLRKHYFAILAALFTVRSYFRSFMGGNKEQSVVSFH